MASGKVAQKAALSLPPASRRSFKDICRAVMDNLGLYPEDYHQQFQDSQMMAEDQLFTWAWSSSWTAWKWHDGSAAIGQQAWKPRSPLQRTTWLHGAKEQRATASQETTAHASTEIEAPMPSSAEKPLLLWATNHFLPGPLDKALEEAGNVSKPRWVAQTQLLGTKSVSTCIYHLQTDGLVE